MHALGLGQLAMHKEEVILLLAALHNAKHTYKEHWMVMFPYNASVVNSKSYVSTHVVGFGNLWKVSVAEKGFQLQKWICNLSKCS